MSRAFDKVHHSFLLIKLRHLNFNSRLHNWFRSYLLGRRQQVIVLGVTSQELNFLLVAARVPFGTNVAFGIRQRLKQIYCTLSVACFADNTKLYQRADSIADGGALQSDMTSLFQRSLHLLARGNFCTRAWIVHFAIPKKDKGLPLV